jgi:PAS domain S-box-containing protein
MNVQQPVRILYVDDSAHDRALVRHALEIEPGPFRVTEAATRAEFEAQLAHGDFDLVLSDFNILGYDGLQVLDAVKAKNPRLPVLIVTGTGSEEIAVEAMKRGAADYVIKTPQHIQRLPLTIQSVITRHHGEQRLARISRARAMMARCNRVLVHATEEAQLLREMCRIVVEAGDYRMAWIGFAENDANKSVAPVAQAGIEEGYLATMRMTWSDSERGRGPTGTAIRTGKPAVARHIPTHPDFAPWREEALKRGYASNLALPLSNGSGAIGVLGIYASEADAFDTEEVALLEELADDIGYGIGSLRARIARPQAEAALRDSQARLAGILDIAEDAIIAVNENHCIILFNQGAERLFGYRSLEALGQPLDLLLPERFREAHGQHITKFAGSPEAARRMGMRSEVYGLHKDGSEFPAEASISKFELGGGKVFTVILRDITERKQAERRIRGQLEHLNLLDHITRAIGERQDLRSIFQVVVRSLEDSLPIDFGCVCLHDQPANALRVTCVGVKSEALAHELTIDEKVVIGIDDNGLGRCVKGRLVYEPDIGEVRFPFPERLARGGLRSLVMAPLRSESRVFGVLVAARREAQGFSSVECEFLRQLSEHVALAAHQAQLYGALQQAYDDLRQTQQAMMQEERLRAVGQMASGIAHDINNALSPVSLYAESMLETERNLSDRARGYLQTIQRSVEDVAQTVARMREFYRPREAQLALTPVELNSIVQQVVDLTRARWSDMPQQRGIVIHALTELAPDLPKIMGVESEIRESLTNLVFNAVDAMPEGGTLTLRTRLVHADPEQPAVVVEVVDSGVGMDEDTRRRCLEPFFTTKGERGTGLGLAMVYGMVQRHSAELEIESASGAGTTVRLVFAIPAAIPAEPAGRPAAPLKAPSRLRLLLIDDDPILLKSLRDALEADAHVIVTANGGEEGIAAFRMALDRGETFAAVITDLGMPYVDGRRVAATVKAASPATPVIMLTGWGRRLVADGDIPSYVDRVLAKPPKLRELREALAQLCRPGPS